MTRRSPMIVLLVLLAGLLAPAGAAADATDDASDTRTGSRALAVPPLDPLLIDRPGDRDWYIEPGAALGAPGRTWITVSVDGGSAGGCPSAEPLKIALHNPEGRWIRSVKFARGDDGELPIPALPGNYFINVSAVDEGCSGLTYALGRAAVGEPAIGGETGCDAMRRHRSQASSLLDRVRDRRDKVTGAARLRYDAYVNTARTQLAAARRSATRACRNPGPRPAPPPPSSAEPGPSGGGGGG